MYIQWLSVYDLTSGNVVPANSEELKQQPHEEDDYSQEFTEWLQNVNWDLLDARSKWKIWKTVKLTDKVELDLLRNATLTKLRLSMLYSQWNETEVNSQEMYRSQYYKECAPFSDGLIKEISFSSCGRLILDPSPQGFQLLGFDGDLNNYSFDPVAQDTNNQYKPLTVVKEFILTVPYLRNTPPKFENCLCAKFSPDNSIIVCGSLEGKVTWWKVPNDLMRKAPMNNYQDLIDKALKHNNDLRLRFNFYENDFSHFH